MPFFLLLTSIRYFSNKISGEKTLFKNSVIFDSSKFSKLSFDSPTKSLGRFFTPKTIYPPLLFEKAAAVQPYLSFEFQLNDSLNSIVLLSLEIILSGIVS